MTRRYKIRISHAETHKLLLLLTKCCLTSMDSLNVDFLALCIEYSMTKIKQAAKGLIPGISREDILNLVIPIPPIKEQENICNKLKVTFSAIEHIEKSLN